MGFLILLFVFVVIAIGMYGIYRLATRPFRDDEASPIVRSAPPDRPDMPDDPRTRAVLQVIYNEGYFGVSRVNDDELIYVSHEVLSDMLGQLDSEQDLAWVLPKYRLRLRLTPLAAPEWVSDTYSHVVMTPTHAFGARRHTH